MIFSNMSHMLHSARDNFHQVWTQSTYLFPTYHVFTPDTLHHAVTLTFDPRVVYWLACNQTLYQMWAKSNSLQLRYSKLKIKNLWPTTTLDLTVSGFSKLCGLQGYSRKVRPSFALFNPCKNKGKVGEISESGFQVQPRTKPLICFCQGTAVRAGKGLFEWLKDVSRG